jgi:hypothetical protein
MLELIHVERFVARAGARFYGEMRVPPADFSFRATNSSWPINRYSNPGDQQNVDARTIGWFIPAELRRNAAWSRPM